MKVTRNAVAVSVVGLCVLTLAGCATGRKSGDLELQGLRNQVALLESQIQAKDEELNSLKESLDKVSYEAQSASRRVETKFRPKAKDIQTALRNTGYYSGVIDGVLGKKTREAVKEFQKANNLKADGKVGAQTWELLKGSLDQKVK